MKKQSLQLLAGLGMMLLLFACKKEEKTPAEALLLTPDTQSAVSAAALAYQMVWSDEFDGSSLNTSRWNYENGNLGVNNEKQYYQSSNVSVSNGNLVITARKQSVGGQPYTSGRINTNGKFSQKYGRIEARIKLTAMQGIWPAFWMLGTNIGEPNVGWPRCGEIDIMEQVNASNTVYGTIHWDANGYTHYGGNTSTSIADYHVYAVEWDASAIRWYVDNNLYHTANIQNNINSTEEFHKNFFLILNVAVGGDFPGQTIDESKLPATMMVDYVRVYNIVNTPGGAPIGSTISLRASNNLYASGENGTQAMNCNRTSVQAWEQFTVVDAGGGKVALRSQGKYVSSENGTQAITCDRATVGDWEKFDWVANSDGSVSLRGNNGRYISSENGTQPMTCNRTSIGGWETFRY